MSSASPAPRLWLLRHAQPLIAPGICYGQLDVAADAADTDRTAHVFAAAWQAHIEKNFSGAQASASIATANARPLPVTVLRHSSLQRCELLTRSVIACMPNLAFTAEADARLQEMDFGHWEGLPWDAIARTEVDAWAANLSTYAPGSGEPLTAMLQRVKSALQHSWQHDSLRGQRDVVWVTHAGVIRCVQWLLQCGNALPTSADWNLPAPGFGQWTSLPWSAAAPARAG